MSMPIQEDSRLRHAEFPLPSRRNMCGEESDEEQYSGTGEGVEDDAGRTKGSWPASLALAPGELSDSAAVFVSDVDKVCYARVDGDDVSGRQGSTLPRRGDCSRRRSTRMLMVWLSWTAVVILCFPCVAAAAAYPSLFGDEDEENLVGRSTTLGRSSRRKRDYITDDEQQYLMRFGYLPQSDLETGNLRSEDQLHEAIARLQEFAGLKPTGKFDESTKRLLKKPRCGVEDYKPEDESRRKKRFTLRGPKWEHTNLTWSLRIPPRMQTKSLDPRAVQRELQEALEIWAEHSKLTFQNVNSDKADIVIEFSRQFHGDGFPFDGRGKILAHAFFPGPDRGGDAHFDDDELWFLKSDDINEEGTNLFMVAAHEFGHSLGLAHSNAEGALMYPWYQGTVKEGKFNLPTDDKHGIQQLYGAKDERAYGTIKPYRPWLTPPTTPSTPRTPHTRRPSHGHPPHGHTTPRPHYPHHPPTPKAPSEIPDTCNTNYDAISMIRGELFIFKDKYFWRISDRALTKVQPYESNRFFYNLPSDFTRVDAVYERKDQKIVFFIGNKYYLYDGNKLAKGYPQPLTHLGLPSTLNKIDGAMVWGHNSKTYLFSGTMYWRLDDFTNKVELDYPRDMVMWRGVDYNIDSVFRYTDGITYFFKGKGYWAFDDRKMRVRHKVQKLSASKWMKCPAEEENLLRPSPEYELEERFGYSKALPCRTYSVMSFLLPVVYYTLSSLSLFEGLLPH